MAKLFKDSSTKCSTDTGIINTSNAQSVYDVDKLNCCLNDLENSIHHSREDDMRLMPRQKLKKRATISKMIEETNADHSMPKKRTNSAMRA